MARQEQKLEDVPMIENYPPLRAWLMSERLNARCLWQTEDERRPARYRIEAWAINARVVLVLIHADKKGWELYTNCDSNNIDESLLDAERRVKLGLDETEGPMARAGREAREGWAKAWAEAMASVKRVLAAKGLDSRDHVAEEILNALGVGQ